MKKIAIRMILALTAFVAMLSPAALITAPVYAADDSVIQDNLCAGAKLDVTDPNCTQTQEAPEKVNEIIATVIRIFSIVVGFVSVIMIIVGGFQYITSGGASDKVTTAKNTILFAIVGLVIVALAQIIVQFVLSKATDI